MTGFALTPAEQKYVKGLLPGKEVDDMEVAARLLEMIADSLTGGSEEYVRHLAAMARQKENEQNA
jgi:hypothetical protein